jgi:hypothetical protein
MFSSWARRVESRLLSRRGHTVGVLAATAGLLGLWAVALVGSAAALPSNCTQSGSTVTCTFTGAGTYTFTPPAGERKRAYDRLALVNKGQLVLDTN